MVCPLSFSSRFEGKRPILTEVDLERMKALENSMIEVKMQLEVGEVRHQELKAKLGTLEKEGRGYQKDYVRFHSWLSIIALTVHIIVR